MKNGGIIRSPQVGVLISAGKDKLSERNHIEEGYGGNSLEKPSPGSSSEVFHLGNERGVKEDGK